MTGKNPPGQVPHAAPDQTLLWIVLVIAVAGFVVYWATSCAWIEDAVGDARDIPIVDVEDAKARIGEADTDADGRLSWNEIEAWLKALREGDRP